MSILIDFFICLILTVGVALYQLPPETATVAQVLGVLHSPALVGIALLLLVMVRGVSLGLSGLGCSGYSGRAKDMVAKGCLVNKDGEDAAASK